MIDPKAVCFLTATMMDAMERLNAMAVPKYVLVVDQSNRLLGTVTDGDIRRALLKGMALSKPVSSCMNTAPIVVATDHRHQAARLLKERGITFVPVVDKSRTVVDVVVEHQGVPENIAAVLMAGGLGTRLLELTRATPKPLLHVAGKPILERIVDRLESAGFNRIYITVNYLAEQIIDFFQSRPSGGARIKFIREKKRMGTAGSLSLIPNRPAAPVLVANADLVTEVDFESFVQFHMEYASDATVGAVNDFEIPYGVLECDEHGQIRAIKEKPKLNLNTGVYVNAGVYVLSPPVLDLIPVGTYSDMPDVLNLAVAKGFKVGVFPIHEYWLDVGRPHEFEKAKQDRCPKCSEGVMRLPLAIKPLEPGELGSRREGTKLECSKCGYSTTSLAELNN